MKYKEQAVAITSQAEFDAALEAGAEIEFTIIGSDTLDMPRGKGWLPGSSGWIDNTEYNDDGWDWEGQYRAFYPEDQE